MLITPERPAPPPKLALVPYNCAGNQTTTTATSHWWWPAIVYSSYGQAMDERHETLSLATSNRFLRKMYETHCARLLAGLDHPDETSNKTMHVAQLLGYDDLWVEFDATQQKNMLAHVLEALAQREKLPSEIQNAYDLAFEQLKLLLSFDPRTADGSTTIDDIVSGGICHNLNATTTTQPRKLSTTTPVNTNGTNQQREPPSSALIVSSTKRSAPVNDPSRIWGREKQARSMKTTGNGTATISTSETTTNHGPVAKRSKTVQPCSHNTNSTRATKIRTTTATTTKTTLKKSSVMIHRPAPAKRRQLPRLTASQRAQRSRDNFYVFHVLWPRLKEDGWTLVKAGNPLYDWYYIRPGNNAKDAVKNGTMGVDFFTSTEQVIEWAKSIDYRSSVGVMTSDDSSCCALSHEEGTMASSSSSHVSGTDADESHAGEEEETLHTNTTEEDDSRRMEDDESACDDSSGYSIPQRRTNATTKSFAQTWKQLRENGWTMVEARKYNPNDDATWYYVRPNVENILRARRGRDYFATPAELMDWVATNDEEEDESGEAPMDRMIMTPPFPRTVPRDPAKPQLPEETGSEDERGDELAKFEWNNLWRRIQPFGWRYVRAGRYNPLHDTYYVRPGRTVEQGILGEDYFLTAHDVIAFEMRREGIAQQAAAVDKNANAVSRAQKMRRITLSPAKPIQKRTREAPTLRPTEWWQKEPIPSFSDVWRLLNLKLGFRYSNGYYSLPKGVQHPNGTNWSLDADMRTFLCQYGIPNLDSNVLTPEEITTLVRWTAFAHVPVKNTNSLRLLQNLQVLTKPMTILTPLGVVGSTKHGYSIPSSPIPNMSLEQLRVHIRGLRELVMGRRNARQLPLNDGQLLELRLWAALSPEPLPTFGMNL